MVYNIKHYNGDPLISVPDSTIDSSTTSIALIGQNSVNFGLALNNNFIALMQHFASPSPPPNPLQGQLWFYTVDSILKVYSGINWLSIPLPFDGNAGTAIVAISNINSVVVVLSCGEIISVVSHQPIDHSDLPTTVSIADVTYQFASRFIDGLLPGINLAIDPNGYQFVGNATSANVLITARNIILEGSISGNIYFDGSNDVVINNQLINAVQGNVISNANVSINLPSWFSNVFVNSNGIITDATAIISNDVVNALGYVPPAQVNIIGDVGGISIANGNVYTVNVAISNSNVSPGTYNTVTVDQRGIIQSGTISYPIPVNGIILWNSFLVPTGWATCNGSTVNTPTGLYTTPNLTNSFVGGTTYIVKVY